MKKVSNVYAASQEVNAVRYTMQVNYIIGKEKRYVIGKKRRSMFNTGVIYIRSRRSKNVAFC